MPSLTTSMIDLSLAETLVGITDYCDPLHVLQDRAARVGGPKTPNVPEITILRPDLVLANPEENQRQAVEALREAGVPVWISFPETLRESIEELWELVGFYQSKTAGMKLDWLDKMLNWAEAAAESREKPALYFCPIWQETSGGATWWMTFNEATVSHDFLRILGGENVFAKRERRYPLAADLNQEEAEAPAGRDTRYPRVTQAEIIQAAPEVILLPSEPFAYEESHRQEFSKQFAKTPAAENGYLRLVDGQALTWYGTRMIQGLEELADLFAAAA